MKNIGSNSSGVVLVVAFKTETSTSIGLKRVSVKIGNVANTAMTFPVIPFPFNMSVSTKK